MIKDQVIGTGLPASDGAVVGQLVFTSDAAEECRSRGQPCVLFKHDLTLEDIVGLEA